MKFARLRKKMSAIGQVFERLLTPEDVFIQMIYSASF